MTCHRAAPATYLPRGQSALGLGRAWPTISGRVACQGINCSCYKIGEGPIFPREPPQLASLGGLERKARQDKENRHHCCHQRRFLTSTRQSRVSPTQTRASSQRGAALSPRIHGSKNCHQTPGTLSPERQAPNRPCHQRDRYPAPRANSPVTIVW